MVLTPVFFTGKSDAQAGICQDIPSNDVTIAYFHMISNLLFSNNLTIRRSVVSGTDSIIK
jgi:hypothetical protein